MFDVEIKAVLYKSPFLHFSKSYTSHGSKRRKAFSHNWILATVLIQGQLTRKNVYCISFVSQSRTTGNIWVHFLEMFLLPVTYQISNSPLAKWRNFGNKLLQLPPAGGSQHFTFLLPFTQKIPRRNGAPELLLVSGTNLLSAHWPQASVKNELASWKGLPVSSTCWGTSTAWERSAGSLVMQVLLSCTLDLFDQLFCNLPSEFPCRYAIRDKLLHDTVAPF